MRRSPQRLAFAAGSLALAALVIALGTGGGGRGRGRITVGPSASTSASAPTGSTAPYPSSTASPPAAPGPPALPAPAGEQFGVSVNRLFNDQSYAPGAIASQLHAARTAGASIARTDALWEAAEPAPPLGAEHRYRWGFDDQVAGALAAAGLRWLAIIDYSPLWASSVPGQEHAPPRSATDYASFAAAFAARYGRGGMFWRSHPGLPAAPVETYEIWNEPDTPVFWLPAPDPSRYAELYAVARNAIGSVDPAARVIVGGLTAPQTTLPALLAARPDLRGRIDGVAIHPYAANPIAVLAKVRTARATLRGLGLSAVPLYVTELGWTTRPRGALSYLPARLRPGYVASALLALGHLDCGVSAVLVYTWVTPERNPVDREDWFGIHPPRGGASPDAAAFAHGVKRARARAPTLARCGSN